MIDVLVGYILIPNLEIEHDVIKANGMDSSYWLYVTGASLIAAGYADFPLMAYHFQKVLYCPPCGFQFFTRLQWGLCNCSANIRVILWSVGAHESLMRAIIAHMAPKEKRGSAYGVFNLGFFGFWFLGKSSLYYGLLGTIDHRLHEITATVMPQIVAQ